MSGVTAPETLCKQPAEKRRFQMSFDNLLAADETISSITSIDHAKIGGGTSDLTISVSLIDSGSRTVSFWIEGGSVGRFRIEVLVVTSSTAKLKGDGILKNSDK